MYEIREYNIKDKEQVIKLWLDICIEEHGFKEWKEEIESLDENEYEKILVAVLDNEVVGTIAYKKIGEEIAELKRVYTHQEHRGKGISKRLFNEMLEIVKENKYKKLLVETWEKFISGRKFYEKNNFVLQNIEGEVYNYILEL